MTKENITLNVCKIDIGHNQEESCSELVKKLWLKPEDMACACALKALAWDLSWILSCSQLQMIR